MRRLLILLALAGCSSSGEQPAELLREGLGRVRGLVDRQPVQRVDLNTINRAVLDQFPFALIFVEGTGGSPYQELMTPLAQNRGVLSFMSPERKAVAIRGGALRTTGGFVNDLVGVTVPDDGLDRPRPLAEWPARTMRIYEHTLELGDAVVRGVDCLRRQGPAETLRIVDEVLTVVQVVESCAGSGISFENRYWVVPGTGAVRKSVQWVSEETGSLQITVVKPFIGEDFAGAN